MSFVLLDLGSGSELVVNTKIIRKIEKTCTFSGNNLYKVYLEGQEETEYITEESYESLSAYLTLHT